MEQVSKGVLKAKMHEYFRRIEETGEPIEVTDNGRPVLRVVPIRRGEPADVLFADLRKQAARGSDKDLMASTEDEWPQLRDDFDDDVEGW